jgi:hypothetical protein
MERFVASELARGDEKEETQGDEKEETQGDEKEETRGAKQFKYMNICNKCGDREVVYGEAVRWAGKTIELICSFGLREGSDCGLSLREAIENGLEMTFGALR